MFKKSVITLCLLFSINSIAFAMTPDEAKVELQKRYMPYTSDVMNSMYFSTAAIQGDKTLMQLWLDAGFNINTKNMQGYTPLIMAILNKNKSAVDLIISLGADCNVTDSVQGLTPLKWAIANQQFDIAETLLSVGVDVNARGTKGGVAIFDAVYQGNIQLTEKLIAAGADISIKNNAGQGIYDFAKMSTNPNMVQYLVSKNNGTKSNNIKTNIDFAKIDEAIKNNGKIKSGRDNFDGTRWYSVEWSKSTPLFSLEPVGTTYIKFNAVFSGQGNSKNLVIKYLNSDVYAIEPFVRVKVDDTVYELTTSPVNISYNGDYGMSSTVFSVPDDFLKAIMETKKEVIVRYTYKTLGGTYLKEITVPYNFITNVQNMYSVLP